MAAYCAFMFVPLVVMHPLRTEVAASENENGGGALCSLESCLLSRSYFSARFLRNGGVEIRA